jgi:transcription elongation factor GreA
MSTTVKDRLLRKFSDEIQALDRELKLELPKEIKRARELGDLRENAEYAAAKERQRLVEARISMLQKRVSEIHLINIDRIAKDKAGFGSTLHVVEMSPFSASASSGMTS